MKDNPVTSSVGALVLLLLSVFVLINLPEVRRYLRMDRM
jgi:hypothetical protein